MIAFTDVHEKFGTTEGNEEVLSYFECCIDNMRGFLVPTDTRLMFLQSGLDNTDKKTLDVKYDMIEEITMGANDSLFITIKNSGNRTKVEPIDTSLQLLEKILKSYIHTKKPADDYCSCQNHILKYE